MPSSNQIWHHEQGGPLKQILQGHISTSPSSLKNPRRARCTCNHHTMECARCMRMHVSDAHTIVSRNVAPVARWDRYILVYSEIVQGNGFQITPREGAIGDDTQRNRTQRRRSTPAQTQRSSQAQLGKRVFVLVTGNTNKRQGCRLGTLRINRRAPGPMTVTHGSRPTLRSPRPAEPLACGEPSFAFAPKRDALLVIACDVANSNSLWYPSCRLSRSSRTTESTTVAKSSPGCVRWDQAWSGSQFFVESFDATP